jgi:hypothetical protein
MFIFFEEEKEKKSDRRESVQYKVHNTNRTNEYICPFDARSFTPMYHALTVLSYSLIGECVERCKDRTMREKIKSEASFISQQ